MGLQGFEHVFSEAVLRDIADGLRVKVITPATFALLKIVAFTDRPQQRLKDIRDLEELLTYYAHDSDLRVSMPAPQLTFEDQGAFLLGQKLAEMCTGVERELVVGFIRAALDEGNNCSAACARALQPDIDGRRLASLEGHLRAVSIGLAMSGGGRSRR